MNLSNFPSNINLLRKMNWLRFLVVLTSASIPSKGTLIRNRGRCGLYSHSKLVRRIHRDYLDHEGRFVATGLEHKRVDNRTRYLDCLGDACRFGGSNIP